MRHRLLPGVGLLAFASVFLRFDGLQRPLEAALSAPVYAVDPSWPKLEGNWMMGEIGGIAIDPTNDHVWVLQRPRTLTNNDENAAAQNPPLADCCVPAPPVMEFDSSGTLVHAWGGAGAGYEWPESEHGLTIDRGNVWVGGNGTRDNHLLKFTKAGKFLLQIGHMGKSAGSNDTQNLNKPAKVAVHQKANEIFVADGYGNRRVVVFDADTGAYKRHWGAYGKPPDDAAPRTRLFAGPPAEQFNLVHAVAMSNDDLLYVGDRSNNRIQVFKPDGTFVKEAFVARDVRTATGTTMDIEFSSDKAQQFLFAAAGDQHIRILDRSTLQVVGTIGRNGRYPGQFFRLHVIAIDSKGNLYAGEGAGKRVQKFVPRKG